MTATDNIDPLAAEALMLARAIAHFEARLEPIKEQLRTAAPGRKFMFPGEGSVAVSKPTGGILKEKWVLNSSKIESLDNATRSSLVASGVLRLDRTITPVRKPSVTIRIGGPLLRSG